MSQQMSQFSQGYIYPSQGFSQDVPEISQNDPGKRYILYDIVYTVCPGWGPRSQLDVLSQDPDYNAYNVQGDRGIDFSQY